MSSEVILQSVMVMATWSLIGTICYYTMNTLIEYLKQKFLTSVTIDNQDPNYKWMLTYLIEKGYLANSMTDLIVKKHQKKRSWLELPGSNKQKKKADYFPAPGSHYFTYKGKKMWAYQVKGKTNTVGWEMMPMPEEQIVICCYGWDLNLVKQLVDDAVTYDMDQEKGLLGIYEVKWGLWIKANTKKARSLDSVVLDTSIAQTLVDDIKRYQKSAEWYNEKGVPYRRGYLLYGPPGTGKTSFVQAVSGALNLNLCYLNLADEHMDDDLLSRLLCEAPEHSIILLEDIDALFKERNKVHSRGLSFSGLLNAIDGVKSQEGQILFMTTNHKEKLDPALLRPGRADVHVNLNNASEKQIKDLFKRFFPNSTQEEILKFSDQLPVFKFSMAKIQGHLLKYREDINKCIENAKDLLDDDLNQTKEMTVQEWLHRLNLLDLYKGFKKNKIVRVTELKYIEKKDIFEKEFDVKKSYHQTRLWNMITGDIDSKENFKYLTKHGVRAIVNLFVSDEKLVDQVVEQIPNNVITGFQLKDVFDESKNFRVIRQKLYDIVMFNKRFPKSLEISKKPVKEGEEDETKKKEKIDVDLVSFFQDQNYMEGINKLQKQDLNDSTLFFKADFEVLEKTLDIKPEGKKARIMKVIKEMKDKLEKEGSIEYVGDGLLDKDGLKVVALKSHAIAKGTKEQMERDY